MTSFSSLLGSKLVTKSGIVDTDAHLAGKVVGLYFSAHWCPPCRGFTPQLASQYKEYVSGGKNFEIVFVSSDRDEASFNDYYGEQPWAAMVFSDRNQKKHVSDKFKIQGIPSLVILDTDGSVITKDGRTAVAEDPSGKNFPWRPKPIKDLIGDSFVGKDGASLDASAITGKIIGIYFSAHWCPPCRGFTPALVSLYKKLKEKGKNFEIIFASSDNDQSAFGSYFGEMPWIAIPHSDRPRIEALKKRFGVRGIPSLVILDEKLDIIRSDGRAAAGADPEGVDFPWEPKALENVDKSSDAINTTPSFLALMEGTAESVRSATIAAIAPVAREYQDAAKAKKEDMEVCFFYSITKEGLSSRIRPLLKLPLPAGEHAPQLAIVDVQQQGYFYGPVLTGAPTEEQVRAFVSDFHAGKLDKKDFGQ